MGMFDRIWAKCPKCGTDVEFQSKAGDCTLEDFPSEAVPHVIAADITGDSICCEKCDHLVTIGAGHTKSFVNLLVT